MNDWNNAIAAATSKMLGRRIEESGPNYGAADAGERSAIRTRNRIIGELVHAVSGLKRDASAGSKIAEGLAGAHDYVTVERAIREWIREDAPLAAKMNLGPDHVAKLVDRITGSRTRVAAGTAVAD